MSRGDTSLAWESAIVRDIQPSSASDPILVNFPSAAGTVEDGVSKFRTRCRAEEQLRGTFARASLEVLEDGIENSITRELPTLLTQNGLALFPALGVLRQWNECAPDIFAESLVTIGRLEWDQDTFAHDTAFWLLTDSLTDDHATIRLGAALALSALANRKAKTFLLKAASREPMSELRDRFQDLASEL